MLIYVLLHNFRISLFNKHPGKVEGELHKFYNQVDESDKKNIAKEIKKYEGKK